MTKSVERYLLLKNPHPHYKRFGDFTYSAWLSLIPWIEPLTVAGDHKVNFYHMLDTFNLKGIQRVPPRNILQSEANRSGDLLQKHTLDLNQNTGVNTPSVFVG